MGGSKHSKKACTRADFTYAEKNAANSSLGGTTVQRLGADSQNPFGYCSLSLKPAEEPVVSPSGRVYSREAILEYLLLKTQEIKEQTRLWEQQKQRETLEMQRKAEAEAQSQVEHFKESQGGVGTIVKRKLPEAEEKVAYMESRKRKIDDTDREKQKEELKKINPWLSEFTPTAAPTAIKEPPKRPPSPFSNRPLRAKDLIPVNLEREVVVGNSSSNSGSMVRFVCHVTKKTITSQKVILIKSTGAMMIETAYNELAKPSMICPVTGKRFSESDVIELCRAATGFAASGNVEAKKYTPTIN